MGVEVKKLPLGTFWKTCTYILLPLVLVLVPPSLLDAAPSLCLIKAIFGVEGPGCGMMRALAAVMHGDLAGALAFNKTIVVVFPLLVLLWAIWLRGAGEWIRSSVFRHSILKHSTVL